MSDKVYRTNYSWHSLSGLKYQQAIVANGAVLYAWRNYLLAKLPRFTDRSNLLTAYLTIAPILPANRVVIIVEPDCVQYSYQHLIKLGTQLIWADRDSGRIWSPSLAFAEQCFGQLPSLRPANQPPNPDLLYFRELLLKGLGLDPNNLLHAQFWISAAYALDVAPIFAQHFGVQWLPKLMRALGFHYTAVAKRKGGYIGKLATIVCIDGKCR